MDSSNKISLADKGHQSKVVIANHRTNNQIKTNQSDSNFEYEDNEWDIGIGDLIIDLDADIEKSSNVDSTLMLPLQTLANSYSTSDKIDSPEKTNNKEDFANMSTMSNSSGSKNSTKLSIDNHQATLDKGLKMKIKRTKMGNKTSDSKHEIVKSEIEVEDQHSKTSPTIAGNKRGNSSHKKEKQSKTYCKDKQENSIQEISSCSCDSDKLTQCANCLKESPQLSDKSSSVVGSFTSTSKALINVKEHKVIFDKDLTSSIGVKGSNDEEDCGVSLPPPSKRSKCDVKDMVDVSVGTSIGTITEPECLGPCEPGTSVTLEGIVWHESEGGVLAVNVTWRGKTYVGTLIDCTKHDWAPPRFCDSPTEQDLESRLQKGGRSKRGRNATSDLLNFTETRSSVHSKLRNGSKVPKQDKRRKSKDESPTTSVNGNSFQANVVNNHAGNIVAAQKQLAAKKPKNLITPCAISPVLIECPEQDCSKKYKHANGLKYHQSHAHGTNFSAEDELIRSDSPSSALTVGEQNKISNEIPDSVDNKLQTQKLDESQNDTENAEKNMKELSVLGREVEENSMNEKLNDFKAHESDGVSNESSVDPNFFQLNSQAKGNLSAVRCKKNRKSPTAAPENVRSPAYSDISDDDSNTPTDSGLIDKKSSELQKSKSNNEQVAASSMLLGSYNHLSFYQSPAFLQTSDPLKSLNQISSPERKEQTPLDLISKMHLDKGSTTTSEPLPNATNESPSVPKSSGSYQHFPYGLMQTSFPFNGENFPPYPPSVDGEKASLTPLKQEKDLEPLKQTLTVKPLSRLEEVKEIKTEPDQQPGVFLNYSKYATSRDEDLERRGTLNSSNSTLKSIKEESQLGIESGQTLMNQKLGNSSKSSAVKPQKEIKIEEKEYKPNKNEGQKPTMETQGPPPPPTNQYYLNLPYHLAGSANGPPFFADHAIYRNMLVPSSYNSPYHLQNLQMARFSSPEDLSRSTANTKALDLLQQHASQYYNTHKIHELNDRVNQLSKSPSNNIRMGASGIPNSSNIIHGNSPMPANTENRTNNPTQQSSGPPNCDSNKVLQMNNSKMSQPNERNDSKDINRSTSPPPQRHHHTHHHTHVYPIYGTPYVNPAAVLASQPAAVAVINPFANPPPK